MNVSYLDLRNNKITKIENLHNNIYEILLTNNPIKVIENLPNKLIKLELS